MNNLIVFFKKEWIENIRTKKLLILLIIFCFFGLSSPILAKYMDEIVQLAAGGSINFEVPNPTWIDGWGQFYSNLSQIGGICIILLFMNSISGERQSGTAALSLTKNLKISEFIIVKFIAASIVFLISLFVGALICYFYTYFLFGYAGNINNILQGLMVYSIFILTLLSFTILASTVAKSTSAVAILGFLSFLLLYVTIYLPFGDVMPGNLIAKTVEVTINGGGDMIVPVLISLSLIICCLFSAVFILKKQEI